MEIIIGILALLSAVFLVTVLEPRSPLITNAMAAVIGVGTVTLLALGAPWELCLGNLGISAMCMIESA